MSVVVRPTEKEPKSFFAKVKNSYKKRQAKAFQDNSNNFEELQKEIEERRRKLEAKI